MAVDVNKGTVEPEAYRICKKIFNAAAVPKEQTYVVGLPMAGSTK